MSKLRWNILREACRAARYYGVPLRAFRFYTLREIYEAASREGGVWVYWAGWTDAELDARI